MPVSLHTLARDLALAKPLHNVLLPVIANVTVISLALAFAWLSFKRQSI